jgi:L-fuconolactonase
MSEDLALFDSHMHLMDPGKFHYVWLEWAPPLNRTFYPEDYAAARQAVNVEGCIFVEVWTAASQQIAEVDWGGDLAAKHPVVKAIIAGISLEDTNATRRSLEALPKRPMVRGVRRVTEAEGPDFSLTPAYIESTRLLAKADLPSDICISNHQLAETIKLVQLCPDTQFVLDHLGKPDIGTDGFDVGRWKAEIKELSRRPNVAAKISGLCNRARQPATVEQIRPYIEYTVECFGAERCMFGSDWPVVTLGGTYELWAGIFKEATQAYSAAERKSLFSATAKRIYRL